MKTNAAAQELPEWNLGDLYAGPDSPQVDNDFRALEKQAGDFKGRYDTRIASLGGGDLAGAIEAYEEIREGLDKLMSYAGLLHAGNGEDAEIARFHQSVQERANRIDTDLLFFSLALNKIEDEALEARLADSKALARYGPWLRDLRAWRPHQLSDDLERLLHEKSVSGRAAWNRLFDDTMTALRFPVGGKELTSAQVFHLLSEKDREVRREAALSIGRVLGRNVRLLALVTNTLAKDKEIEDRWRGFTDPATPRHLSNQVEPEVVEALTEAVRQAYPRLSHRYYALKARWMGSDRLEYWDRNAPLPDEDVRVVSWGQARRTVLEAYQGFAPEMADIAERFFDHRWIDAGVRPGKDSGAFSHPTVPGVHPYILLNFQGRVGDVMTLAHELGHGVHQILAAGQGHLMADTPLTLAETASVFGEMLTFQAMLAAETDPKRRRFMIAGKVEDMLNTVVRQVAFHDFEVRVHAERRGGELTPDRLGQVWMEVQRESLGPALRFDEDYRHYWSYIPHFVHSPFYVYAYAFGECLVNSLYAVHDSGAVADFPAKYLEMLRAGGTLRHKELLAPFGLNAQDPGFWGRGLDFIAALIDELEAGA